MGADENFWVFLRSSGPFGCEPIDFLYQSHQAFDAEIVVIFPELSAGQYIPSYSRYSPYQTAQAADGISFDSNYVAGL
jgi:hypothetical protein